MSRFGDEETGWISMVDFLLLSVVVGAVAVAVSRLGPSGTGSDLDASGTSKGESTVSIPESEHQRLLNEVGEYTVAIEELTRRQEDIRQISDGLGLPPGSSASTIAVTLKGVKDQANAAEEGRRQQEKLRQEAEASARSAADEASAAKSRAADAESAAQQHEQRAERVAGELKDSNERRDTAIAEAAEARRAADDSTRALLDAEAARKALEEALAAAEQELARGGDVKKQLLGLPGELRRVVFVVDRSQSMLEGGRWEDAKRTIAAWIEHLSVESVGLVVFGGTVNVVPERMTPPEDAAYDSVELAEVTDELRAEMVREMNSLDPQGLTPTARALRTSMKFRDLDAIVLFTDGAPEPLPGAVRDPESEVFEIVETWREKHPDAHVHVVGIGSYFERRMRDFLLGVAQRGGGAFIGR
jgi:hypothetical protein